MMPARRQYAIAVAAIVIFFLGTLLAVYLLMGEIADPRSVLAWGPGHCRVFATTGVSPGNRVSRVRSWHCLVSHTQPCPGARRSLGRCSALGPGES